MLAQVVQSILAHIENVTYLFPEETTHTCVLTCGDGIDTWTAAWTEITEAPGGTTLTQKFATKAGYITDIMLYGFLTANIMYMIELGYGATPIVIGRARTYDDWTYHIPLWSARIPAGQTIYYRAKCEIAGPQHLHASFRYHYIIP